jgi:hypothetical protein
MKHKITSSLAVLLFILLAISCTRKPKQNEVWIEGELTGEYFPWIIIEELTPNGVQKIDSVAARASNLTFSYQSLVFMRTLTKSTI